MACGGGGGSRRSSERRLFVHGERSRGPGSSGETREARGTCDLLLVGNVAGEPVETLVQTLAGCGAGGLDVPVGTIQSPRQWWSSGAAEVTARSLTNPPSHSHSNPPRTTGRGGVRGPRRASDTYGSSLTHQGGILSPDSHWSRVGVARVVRRRRGGGVKRESVSVQLAQGGRYTACGGAVMFSASPRLSNPNPFCSPTHRSLLPRPLLLSPPCVGTRLRL